MSLLSSRRSVISYRSGVSLSHMSLSVESIIDFWLNTPFVLLFNHLSHACSLWKSHNTTIVSETRRNDKINSIGTVFLVEFDYTAVFGYLEVGRLTLLTRKYGFQCVDFLFTIIYHKHEWVPLWIPAFQYWKCFWNSKGCPVLNSKWTDHHVPHIRLNDYKEQRNAIFRSFVRCVQ